MTFTERRCPQRLRQDRRQSRAEVVVLVAALLAIATSVVWAMVQ